MFAWKSNAEDITMGLWWNFNRWFLVWDNYWFRRQVLFKKMGETSLPSCWNKTSSSPLKQHPKRIIEIMVGDYSWHWIWKSLENLQYIAQTYLGIWVKMCYMGCWRHSSLRYRRYIWLICSCKNRRSNKANWCSLQIIIRRCKISSFSNFNLEW